MGALQIQADFVGVAPACPDGHMCYRQRVRTEGRIDLGRGRGVGRPEDEVDGLAAPRCGVQPGSRAPKPVEGRSGNSDDRDLVQRGRKACRTEPGLHGDPELTQRVHFLGLRARALFSLCFWTLAGRLDLAAVSAPRFVLRSPGLGRLLTIDGGR